MYITFKILNLEMYLINFNKNENINKNWSESLSLEHTFVYEIKN